MAKLTELSTKEQIEEFLLYHMDSADGRTSTVNPSLTKEQVWNILMGGVVEGTERVRPITAKHAIREFGSYYLSGNEVV